MVSTGGLLTPNETDIKIPVSLELILKCRMHRAMCTIRFSLIIRMAYEVTMGGKERGFTLLWIGVKSICIQAPTKARDSI